MSKKRKAPPRAAKKDPYSLDELLTSSNSKLIDIDLHGTLASYFSDPCNWAKVSDNDKDFIRSLLPPNVELNDDGSIPTEFWKYNSEFRLDCRNLQEDLRAGRMDPEWQRQAAQAMEERTAGKFDDFKEKEFEEYWGQKQKVDWNVLAGHASKVKLDEMLKEGIFKVGDAWSFDHTWGRGADALRVEKECKIVKITRKSVTLAIPPGQLKFAKRLSRGSPSEKEPAMEVVTSEPAPEPEVYVDEEKVENKTLSNGETGTKEEPFNKEEPVIDSDVQHTTPARIDIAMNKDAGDHATTATMLLDGDANMISPDNGNSQTSPKSPERQLRPRRSKRKYASSSPTPSSKISKLNDQPTPSPAQDDLYLKSLTTEYDVILHEITGLYALEKKILELDGRAKPGSRTGSTWRDIRCRRDEQDMGSLFEMRDEYYAYKVAEGEYCRPEVRKGR